MDHEIAHSLIVDIANADGGAVYTPAVETGGRTGVRLFVSAMYAPSGINLTAEIQQSVDLINWSAGLFSTTAITTTPRTSTAETTTTATMPLAGHVRVKFLNASGRACVNATLTFFDFNS